MVQVEWKNVMANVLNNLSIRLNSKLYGRYFVKLFIEYMVYIIHKYFNYKYIIKWPIVIFRFPMLDAKTMN